MTAMAGSADYERGPARPEVTLDDVYVQESGRVLISGIQALVRLAIDQRRVDRARGLDTAAFVSGYEGSPLGGLDLEFGRARRHLDEYNVVFQPGLNEELAATAVAGTQLVPQLPGRRHAGVVGFWYGKNPGLDRAADAIRHANFAGTAPLGGAVAWIGDDPSCKSSTLPSACEPLAKSLHLPLFAPASISEILLYGLHAVALSRRSGLWAGMKIVADIADSAASVELPDPFEVVGGVEFNRITSVPFLLGARSLRVEQDIYEHCLPAAAAYGRSAAINKIVFEPSRPRIGIISAGLTYAAVSRAIDDLGLDESALESLGIRLIKLGLVHPLDHAHLRQLTSGLEEVLVIEEKSPFLEVEIKAALYGRHYAPRVSGKADPEGRELVPLSGVITSDVVARVMAERLGRESLPENARRRLELMTRREPTSLEVTALPARTPYFCSGCPHNRSTKADDAKLVGTGIGCHIMVLFDDHDRGAHIGLTQMGGEGTQWIGMAPFTDDPHYVQNLGDGTFFHSGSLALRAAVAAGVDITYKLLYNDAVAMTGGQVPEGRLDIAALTKWLAVEGVRQIVITTPEPAKYNGVHLASIAEVRHRDQLEAAQADLAGVKGVTVLIHDDRCAAEKRRLRKRHQLATPKEQVWINSRVCEGCGDCAQKSSCLSVVPIETEFGSKRAIHTSSCNQDFSCLLGDCPSFLLVEPAKSAKRAVITPDVALPEPVLADVEEQSIRMPGIGGTGVVTTSRIVQMAAHLAGWYAASIEQTGLAQKGGPVISDVRLSRHPIYGSVRPSIRSLDVLLGFDVLGAAALDTLAAADEATTVAVINTAQVATAVMATQQSDGFPAHSEFRRRIDRRTRRHDNIYFDALEIATRFIGDDAAANLVVLGAASQAGLLPIDPHHFEAAIKLNGTAVDSNLAAFAWGRVAVADPGLIAAKLAPQLAQIADPTQVQLHKAVEKATVPWPIEQLINHRYVELLAYGGARYAKTYLSDVLSVANTEQIQMGEPGEYPITTAFARHYFKLMAFKDEYEVARLHLDEIEQARLEENFGPGAKVKFMLQPPLLKRFGLGRKIALGRTARPAFRILRSMRRLRGTPFDPFGYGSEARAERQLAQRYLQLTRSAMVRLNPATFDDVLVLVDYADVIRGYAGVRAEAVGRWERETQVIIERLDHGADLLVAT